MFRGFSFKKLPKDFGNSIHFKVISLVCCKNLNATGKSFQNEQVFLYTPPGAPRDADFQKFLNNVAQFWQEKQVEKKSQVILKISWPLFPSEYWHSAKNVSHKKNNRHHQHRSFSCNCNSFDERFLRSQMEFLKHFSKTKREEGKISETFGSAEQERSLFCFSFRSTPLTSSLLLIIVAFAFLNERPLESFYR